jgi:hypothetical protein
MLFMVGMFIILVIMVTVFGQGIAYNFMGFIADIEPYNLQENIRNILTVASYTPGDFEARIQIDPKHIITLSDTGNSPTVWVQATQTTYSDTSPQPFLTDCAVIKTCQKSCMMIGDKCTSTMEDGKTVDNCCGMLSCDATGHCKSTYDPVSKGPLCGNGKLDDGEECDGSLDLDCPGECSDDCSCENGPVGLNIGEECTYDSGICYRMLACMSEVKFEKIGGTLVINKYYHGDQCVLEISGVQ